MKTVHIGGVPEHFNLAWYLTLKSGDYKNEDINLRWKDFYGGTGEMNKALRDGEIDMAVILTEGIVKDIVDGNPSKIVQTFVETPLIWGIHVAVDSDYHSIEDLKGTKAAISRFGSGSHLMAFVNAKRQEWNLDNDLEFEVIKDLEGAIMGLTDRKADYFMWEKFTTKPIVDRGIFRRIGECPTPWPCFVIACRNEFIKNNSNELRAILSVINASTKHFKSIQNIEEMIAKRYDQKLEDVRHWLSITKWSQQIPSNHMIDEVQEQLFELKIIDKKLPFNELVNSIT